MKIFLKPLLLIVTIGILTGCRTVGPNEKNWLGLDGAQRAQMLQMSNAILESDAKTRQQSIDAHNSYLASQAQKRLNQKVIDCMKQGSYSEQYCRDISY